MKIFVLGLPHTKTHPDFLHEGFTTKVWNLCKMFTDEGHEVVHLGVEGSNPACTKNIDVVSNGLWEKYIGFSAHKAPVLDPTPEEAASVAKERSFYEQSFAFRAKEALVNNCKSSFEAIVCVTWGGAQWAAIEGVDQFTVEAGIGYYPERKSPYRVFESNAWAHLIRGKEGDTSGGYWNEAVIPNVTDPGRFEFKDKKSDYFLLMGRMNTDKGIGIAADISSKLGKTLILAGTPGVASNEASKRPPVKFMPNVSEEVRSKLMSEAKALFAPSWYPEPFGQVVIEALMSGTPVISTDWGAFPETNLHGVTGYRCRTMDQFYRAAIDIDKISHQKCRDWAVNNFSLKAVAPLWTEYFQTVMNLGKKTGWYTYTNSTGTGWNYRSYV